MQFQLVNPPNLLGDCAILAFLKNVFLHPVFLTRKKRLSFLSHLMGVSTSCCAAQDADFSSDDNVASEICGYSELQHRMQRHATSGSIRKALETLNFMRDYIPGKPTVYDYNSMIRCYFRSGNVVLDELFEVYIGMKRSGPTPNLLTYQTLLNGIISGGALKVAILIMEEMVATGFRPSYTVLSKLFKKLLKVESVMDAALVLEIMLNVNSSPSQDTFAEDVFTTPYYGLYEERLWDEAFHWLDEMENVGCKPSLVTYTVVVKFLCDDGKVDEALSLLRRMEEKGCDPDLVAYNIVLRELCHQGRVVEIGDLVRVIDQKSMVAKGFRPTNVSYNIILKGLCKEEHMDEALALFDCANWPTNGLI
ncbi:hypothetical protein Sango_2226800 [Sesamum angolense]|uniref:Pentatricopeptide repeat-containing protein n=1 Tax=Sesamum angolense TaxID=2727404 RepID=A0AAE1W8S7_9LAMI|nr:hypothetical protein Sango_2226800 [Sesamum angolense]